MQNDLIAVELHGKFGSYLLIKCKVLQNGSDEVIFGKINDPIASSKTKGEIITIKKNEKGKWYIFAGIENKRSNEGLTPVNNILPDVLTGVDLPELMSEEDKKRLAKLIKERAKLLTYTIEVMRNELNDKGLEFHEGSIRSLSVSLFIHISRFID